MKNLNKKVEGYKIGSAIMVSLGQIIMGFGIYNNSKGDELSLGVIGMGAMFCAFGGAYYLGREDQKRADENNYQTKPEDYQNKK